VENEEVEDAAHGSLAPCVVLMMDMTVIIGHALLVGDDAVADDDSADTRTKKDHTSHTLP